MSTRREFLGVALGAGVAGLAGTGAVFGQTGMNILILGGTGFIGPHLVEYAMRRGHKITLFNRGRTNTHLFPEAEKLVGDRNDNLSALEGRQWDAVIDNSGYTPQQVRLSVDLLKNATDQYLFTSTRAVYTERIVQESFGAKTLITRPPVIVGPGDRSDRFTYWVDRIDDGGNILVQGDPTDPIQFVDVRDLSEFYVRLIEKSITGIFNTEGPGSALSTAGLIHGIKAVTSTPSDFTWVDWDFLIKEGETPQNSLPFWQPPRGSYLNYGRMVNTRAIENGMTFRPLAVIAKDTLDWHRTRTADEQDKLRVGMTREREAELLWKWQDA
jgi:2'-hydroxyisoflavone reductase